MPSLTRSGRPSFSFSERPSSGRRCTALRARSESAASVVTGSRSYPRPPRAPGAPGGEHRQSAEAGDRRQTPGQPERRSCTDRTDHGPADGKGAELRRVAHAVPGGERAPVALGRDARMDQGPRGDVLDAVTDAPDEVAGDHEPEYEPERREELPETL